MLKKFSFKQSFILLPLGLFVMSLVITSAFAQSDDSYVDDPYGDLARESSGVSFDNQINTLIY